MIILIGLHYYVKDPNTTHNRDFFFFKCFLSVCPIWLPIFSYFSMNEPELGAGIDPGMAFNPFPSSIWIRQDSNPQPLVIVIS